MRARLHVIQDEAAEVLGEMSAPPMVCEHLLSGHSGARVVLHSRGGDSFVRKTAAGVATSRRLAAQADKQQGLWRHGLPFPKVRSQSTDTAGVASFDMNYIPGRTVADAVANGGAFDAVAVVKAVERLTWLFKGAAGAALAPVMFENKIAEVAHAAMQRAQDFALRQAIGDCARRLAVCDWSGVPESPCHGDLTLENILLTAGKSIAFIDCDETFAASWWLDFGKLFQDIDGHWCLRALYDGDAVRLMNARQKLEQLGAPLRRLARQFDPALPPRLPQLAALGLFRAMPYARSEIVMAFLCRRIQRVLEA